MPSRHDNHAMDSPVLTLKDIKAAGRTIVTDSFNSQVQDTELGTPYKVWGNAFFDTTPPTSPKPAACIDPHEHSLCEEDGEGASYGDGALSSMSSIGQQDCYGSSEVSSTSRNNTAGNAASAACSGAAAAAHPCSASLCSHSAARLSNQPSVAPSQADPVEAWEAAQRQNSICSTSSINHFAMQQPAPSACGLVRCYVRRTKSKMPGVGSTYTMHLQSGDAQLLAARKQLLSKGSSYLIARDMQSLKKDADSCCAKLKANVMGTEYMLMAPPTAALGSSAGRQEAVGKQEPQEQLCISFRPNGLDTGPRSMTVVLPEDASKWQAAMPAADAGHRSLSQVLALAKRKELPMELERRVVLLCSKPPEYDEVAKGFTLDFKGRPHLKHSTKNFQLVSWDNNKGIVGSELILQFAKLADDTFALDFAYPMRTMSAFAIALASLDDKLCYALG